MSEITETEINYMTKEQNYMRGYRDGRFDVLDKIVDEISEYKSRKILGLYLEKGKEIALDYVLAIIDKYKAESEDKMQIVIEIDDNLYTRLFDNGDTNAVDMLKAYVAIRKGTPLPKGHGDLIDKGIFKKWIETQDGDRLMTEYYLDALDAQEPIIGGSYDGNID